MRSMFWSAFLSCIFVSFGWAWEPGAPETVGVVQDGAEKVMVIPLTDNNRYMVDQVQADFIVKALDRAEEENFDRVILKIDTYGGVVMSARDITERLLRLKVKSVAYVETKAISAGTFIAYACDEIVMGEHTTLGDAQMIMQTAEGIEEAPEKAVTVFRADWRKACEMKNRSFALARGFFEVGVEVLKVGSEQNFTFMTRDDYEFLKESERPAILKIVVREGELLTLFAKEAGELGIARVVKDFDAYLTAESIDAASVEEVDMDFKQEVLRFLGANPWIFMLLTLIGLNGIYMEIKMPGFGVPGLTAILCFTIVFGTRFILGTASGIELALFVVGIMMCVAEIFVVPGFGVTGILGIVFMFGALVFASLPDFGDVPIPIPQTDFQWQWMGSMVRFTAGSFVLSFVAFFVLVTAVFKSPLARPAVLSAEMTAEAGYVAEMVPDADTLKGLHGTVMGGLRPAGKVEFEDGRRVGVVSEGPFVEDGEQVKVLRIEGNRIIVRPVKVV